MISADHIKKIYSDREVLCDISFQIPEGEIFGLLGPSGAGKTTLIKILTGQIHPSGGRAFMLGTAAEKLTAAQRRSIGIMMDEFGVYERLSCYDNLKVFADLYGVGRKEILDTLSAVRLDGCERRPAEKLSKGMKSRLRLARAFLTNPRIMFLDEPTSGLDPATTEDIHSMILERLKLGATVFLTTHNMAEAEKLCDRIALLDKGRIIESGAPTEVCRRHNHLKQIALHLSDGRDVSLPAVPSSAQIISEYISEGVVETIHSSEPDLESVFMELTGHKLDV